MDVLKKKYTNNTLEEELREIICDQLKQINFLKNQVKLLEKNVSLECAEKYRAYARIAQLASRSSELSE